MSGMRMNRLTDPERRRLGRSVVHPPAKPVASPRHRYSLSTVRDADATSPKDVTVTMANGHTFTIGADELPKRKSPRRDAATKGQRTTTAGAARERQHGVTLAQVQAAILSGQPIKGY